MAYHDDLTFIGADHLPDCRVEVDREFPGTWSLEFIAGGAMHLTDEAGDRTVLDRPAVFWHLPGNRYRYGPAAPEGWDHHWVLMKGDRARRIVEEGLGPLAPAGWLPVVDPARFRTGMRDLIDLVVAGDPRRQARRVALVEDLVAQVVEQPAVAEAGPHRPLILALADAIRADPLQPRDPAT